MRVLLNFSSIRKGGGIQVALSIIEQLHRYSSITWGIIYNPEMEKAVSDCNHPNVMRFRIEFHPLKITQRSAFLKEMNGFEERFAPDIVFSLFGPSYWKPKSIHLEGFAIPHYVFTASPYFSIIGIKLKLFHAISRIVKTFFLKWEANYWVVENKAIAPNLAALLNVSIDRVYTVPNTYHQVFDHPQLWQQVNLPDKQKDVVRLICISAYYPHKNLELIPKLLDSASANGSLKLEIVTTIPDKIYRMLNAKGHSNWINLGPVKIEQCPLLYQNADALFLPTLLESFSASYVEAMRMGIPIITTDLPFAHAVCEEAALYFEPMSSTSALEKVICLSDRATVAHMLAKGKERLHEFGTSGHRLEKYIAIFYKLLSSR